MLTERQRIENQFKHYKDALSLAKANYILSLDNYHRFYFKILDRYKVDNIKELVIVNESDAQKLIVLTNIKNSNYGLYLQALRDLYNFSIIVVETCKEYGVINKNFDFPINDMKSKHRKYKGVLYE